MSNIPFAFDLQLFAADGDPASGESTTQTTTDPKTEIVELSDEKRYSEKHVKKIHDENASYRHKLKEYEAKMKEIEDAKEAEEQKKLQEKGEFEKAAERAEKRAKEAEKKAAEKVEASHVRSIRALAKAQLISEGIIDPDDIALLDLSKVTWDDDTDEPQGVEDLVKAFKKAKPAKFKTADDGGEENSSQRKALKRAQQFTPSTATGGKNVQGEDARKWSKEEMDRNWSSVRL